MTIQEYIDAVTQQLQLPPKVVGRIRRDLEDQLFSLVQGGADQQQAVEKMGPAAELAQQLNLKYADTLPKPPLQPGEMPLLLPWCLIFSLILLAVKGAQWLFGQGGFWAGVLAGAGLLLTAASGLAVWHYRRRR